MRSLIALASFCLVSVPAHALVYAPSETPEDDIYDGQSRLQWIKVASISEGEAEGYRLATVAEAQDLITKTLPKNQSWSHAHGTLYVGSPRSVFYDMGWDIPGMPLRYEGVSIGYVDGGPDSGPVLAGMMSIVTTNGGDRFSSSTGRYSGWLIGPQEDFLANRFLVDPGLYASKWTDAWSYTQAGVVYTRPGWFDDQGRFDTGYFMVRTNLSLSPIPEMHNLMLMAIGLLALPLALTRSKRSLSAA